MLCKKVNGWHDAAGDGASSPTKSIPYNRRVLLKGLLRTIAMSSYAPGNTARPQVCVC